MEGAGLPVALGYLHSHRHNHQLGVETGKRLVRTLDKGQ